MIHPYAVRIMAALPGHSPVELYRSKHRLLEAEWLFVTRGLDQAWEIWVETFCHDKHTISSRPRQTYLPMKAAGLT